MCRARPILGFLCRFAIVFGLLAAPWPGWPETYAKCLCKGATAVYGAFGSKGIVWFEWTPSGKKWLHALLDTTIFIANREQSGANPRELAVRGLFSSRTMAYLPTALAIALILATGISWRRRFWALVWGLVWIHVFIAFLLGLMIIETICAYPPLAMFEISPFWQKVLSLLSEFFFNRSSTPLATAVLIWMVVTFRRNDWINILCEEKASVGKGPRPPPDRTPAASIPRHGMSGEEPTTRNVH